MSQPSIAQLALSPCPRFGWALIALHALTLAPLWLSASSDAMSATELLLSTLVLAHGIWVAWRFAWLRSRRSVCAVHLGPSQACSFIRVDRSRVDGTIHSSTIVTGSLVVIAMRPQSSHGLLPGRFLEHLVIAPDMLDDDPFRLLRIVLKWGTAGADLVPQPPSVRDAARAVSHAAIDAGRLSKPGRRSADRFGVECAELGVGVDDRIGNPFGPGEQLEI